MTETEIRESDIKTILERAIELDSAEQSRHAVDQLREVAAEAGISPASLEQALAEHTGKAKGRLRLLPRTVADSALIHHVLVALPLASVALGVLTRLVRPFANIGPIHLEAWVAVGIMGATAVGLIASHSADRDPWTLQGRLAGMWTGFFTGYTIVHGSLWPDVVAVTTAMWIGSVVVGALVRRVSHSAAGANRVAQSAT